MQTHFTDAQLADPHTKALEKILRSCVHCGFCTATCPTYVVTGDERDSPRGRIYLIKDMLESGRAATADDVWPIDHCLSCLACVTTCPSGVDYRRLIDHARVACGGDLRAARGRAGVARGAGAAGVVAKVVSRCRCSGPSSAGLCAACSSAFPNTARGSTPCSGSRPKRCRRATPPKGPACSPRPRASRARAAWRCSRDACSRLCGLQINAATIRVLNRLGYDVVLAKGDACCGSLAHHMGHEARGLAQARATIDAWMAEVEGQGLDAIIITASGCGATIKDYGAMLADDPAYAAKAQRIAALAKDVSSSWRPHDFAGAAAPALTLAYQAPCSLQHAQKLMDAPRALLRKIGFAVRDIPEAHLCCGSAGVYNILQPETGDKLRARKLAAIGKVKSDAIVTANVGCLTQIALESTLPIAHAVEYVDWAWGGPKPF